MKKNYYLIVALWIAFTANLGATVITDGFDYVENMKAGSQSFTNVPATGTENVFALISMKDFATYPFDSVYRKMEDNIDMKFYIMGGTNNATVRLYAMDGSATSTKNNEYKGSESLTVDNFIIKNTTKFIKMGGVDFNAATAAQVKTLDFSTATNTINPVEVNDIIAFKTAATSAAGGHRIGLIKIVNIERESETSSKGVITISVKLVKPEPVITEGFDYVLNQKIGTYGFAGGTVAGYENVFSLYSIKDLKTYKLDDIKTNLINVDMKFHLQGAASEPRVYSMNNMDSKNPQYKTSDGVDLKTLLTDETTNDTRYLLMPSTFSFESATVNDVKAIDITTIKQQAIKPAAIGNVIAFKAGPTSTASGTVGIFKIHDIVLVKPENKELGYYIVSFKQLKSATSVSKTNIEKQWKQTGKLIQLSSESAGVFNVFNTMGKLVFTKNATQGEVIDLSAYNTGVYIVEYNQVRSKIILQ